jgi:hypothetical protein
MQTSFQVLAKNTSSVPRSEQNIDGIQSQANTSEYNRGIFKIVVPSQVQPESHKRMRVVMYISIDRSGSMAETANPHAQNQQSKIQFVVSTLNNMVEYIVSQHELFPNVEFYIALIMFDSTATCTLPLVRVSSDTKDHILQIISELTPRGGTNFMNCFREMSKHASAEQEHIENDTSIPEDCIDRMHVFLTDGQDSNSGSIPTMVKELEIMYPLESKHKKQPTQIMIGYGVDHDSSMLQRLCSHFPTAKQWFVDETEKTGCIFGEILWSSINTAFKGVHLVSNVEIYDFTSMEWKKELTVGDITYDSNKTLYARLPWDTTDVSIQLTYISSEDPENKSCSHIETIMYTDDSATIDSGVEKELWRLDTIVTIDEALKFMQNMSRLPYNSLSSEKNRILEKITAFQEKYIAYMNEKNLSSDPFAVQLADDLFVCISGLMSTNLGERYVSARQASQIQQRAVTINDITPLQQEIVSSMPSSNRRTPCTYEETDDFSYLPSSRTLTASNRDADNAIPQNSDEVQQPSTPRAPVENDESKSAEDAEDEKIVSSFTPSARGVSTKLRYLSRETIIGIRRNISYRDEDTPYSCGGDETFSSHATPQCAVVGRMLSAPMRHQAKPDRTPSAPF